MYKKVTNPLAMQSQKNICESMLELLKTTSFDDITITMLCQQAHLVRKTFYRNFETKEDVLICMLDYHLLEYLEELPSHTHTLEDLSEHFLTFWQTKIEYLKPLQENALFYLLNRLYLHYLDKLKELLVDSELSLFPKKDCYALVFHFGGLCNLLGLWLHNDCDTSIEELIAFTNKT